MSTIKSSTEHLTLNADGAGKEIKFQANGVEKASISSTGVMTATSYAGDGSSLTGIEGVPSGIISMWSGSAAAIPTGWNLCDGTNSTPNLIGKFIKSASTAGGTGGSNTHSHSHTLSAGAHTLSTSQMPSHGHNFKYNSGWNTNNSGYIDSSQAHTSSANRSWSPAIANTGGGGSHSHSLAGSITSGSNEPAYFELCYIMKA